MIFKSEKGEYNCKDKIFKHHRVGISAGKNYFLPLAGFNRFKPAKSGRKWQKWKWHTGSLYMLLNLRTAGGRISTPPPQIFRRYEKMAARSAAKFAVAVQPTIWHISKKTMTRWHQRSRLQVTLSDLTSSCVFRSLTSCQRHTSDPNSLKLAVYSKNIGVYNLYISDFWYRWP